MDGELLLIHLYPHVCKRVLLPANHIIKLLKLVYYSESNAIRLLASLSKQKFTLLVSFNVVYGRTTKERKYLYCGPPPKEAVGTPDQMTVSQHSKSEGWHSSLLSPF